MTKIELSKTTDLKFKSRKENLLASRNKYHNNLWLNNQNSYNQKALKGLLTS